MTCKCYLDADESPMHGRVHSAEHRVQRYLQADTAMAKRAWKLLIRELAMVLHFP